MNDETLTDDIAALLSEVITELDNLDSSANVVLQRCVAMRDRLDGGAFERLADLIPDVWLAGAESAAQESRAVYAGFLKNRLENSEIFVQEALRAREALV